MKTALFWAVTQRIVAISYRRFGTTYSFLTFEYWADSLSRNLGNYNYSLRNSAEERSAKLLLGGILKSCNS